MRDTENTLLDPTDNRKLLSRYRILGTHKSFKIDENIGIYSNYYFMNSDEENVQWLILRLKLYDN